jgi:hypothetical protein
VPVLNLLGLPRLLACIARIATVAFLFFAVSSTFLGVLPGTVLDGVFDRVLGRVYASPLAATIHTLDPSASHSQQAPNCLDLVVNGGFEQAGVGWNSMAGASLFTYATDSFVEGQHSLQLGLTSSANITATFGVEQLLTLPAESTSIEFSFHYNIEVEGTASTGDQAYLTIRDASTRQLLAMLVLSPTNGAWSMGRYDLTPLVGKDVHLAFVVQSDGEPGSLVMRVDDVAIFACLPPELFALQPLPTLTPAPVIVPEPLILSPQTATPASPPVAATVTSPQAGGAPQTALVPPTSSIFPQATIVDSLAACSCTSSLYTCSNFSNWSVAQACYTHCQVVAGYDIHNLDPDRNGIACELELQDIASLEATTSTTEVTTGTTAVTVTAPISSIQPLSPQAPEANQGIPPANSTTTNTAPTGGALDVAVQTNTTGTTLITPTEAVTGAAPSTLVTVATPAENVLLPNSTTVAPANPASSDSALSLSPLEMLSLLIFSPPGYLALGLLIIVVAVGLWVAYMVGQ